MRIWYPEIPTNYGTEANPMLILTRRTGETLLIGDDVRVTIHEVRGGSQVRIGIDAPQAVPVHREEVYQRIQQEQVEVD